MPCEVGGQLDGDEVTMFADKEKKQRWARIHADRMQQKFQKWQKPLGIKSAEYRKYLVEELARSYDNPLRKSLIESIT